MRAFATFVLFASSSAYAATINVTDAAGDGATTCSLTEAPAAASTFTLRNFIVSGSGGNGPIFRGDGGDLVFERVTFTQNHTAFDGIVASASGNSRSLTMRDVTINDNVVDNAPVLEWLDAPFPLATVGIFNVVGQAALVLTDSHGATNNRSATNITIQDSSSGGTALVRIDTGNPQTLIANNVSVPGDAPAIELFTDATDVIVDGCDAAVCLALHGGGINPITFTRPSVRNSTAPVAIALTNDGAGSVTMQDAAVEVSTGGGVSVVNDSAGFATVDGITQTDVGAADFDGPTLFIKGDGASSHTTV